MAEEQEFKVIDKRRIKAEGSEAEAPPQAEPEKTPNAPNPQDVTMDDVLAAAEAAAAQAAEGAGDLPPVDTPGALFVCIQLLRDVAWIKLGLTTDLHGKIDRDLPQAKVAIDAVGDLVARLEPFVGDPERRELQNWLSNLRINFVQQSQKG
jgi:hypothetical protein